MFNSLFKSRRLKSQNFSLAHDDFFNALRENEYRRLDKENHIYLDYTGGNLYAESQLTDHYEMLKNNVLGNPHSTNPTSQIATDLVESARTKVLDFFNARDYYCIFTQNASGALKIVGECYPFEEDGAFMLVSDNHNSVNGIREYCNEKGGQYEYLPMNYPELTLNGELLSQKFDQITNRNKLFAFPAQSNVSGVKHNLKWIEKAKEKGWDVLLDAAAFVPTSALDLTKYSPDFVSVSFYKIFGYPTGIGALLVKKTAFSKLRKHWFAGGTVQLASVITPHHFLTENHERFENGTLNYLGIPAIKIGLDYIESIGMKRINERIASLTNYLHTHIKDLRHSNGENILTVYGPVDRTEMGGTIVMNFKNPDGSKIHFEKIEALANQKNISIRSGCFCNPGLDETNNRLSETEISDYFSSRDKGNYRDMIAFLNKMRGATRVSIGIATNKNDLDTFISFVKELKDTTIAGGN